MIFLYISFVFTAFSVVATIYATIGLKRRLDDREMLTDNSIGGRRRVVADIRTRQWLTRFVSGVTKMIVGMVAVIALLTGDQIALTISTWTTVAGFFIAVVVVIGASVLDLRAEDEMDREVSATE